jgi:hypothetical protein
VSFAQQVERPGGLREKVRHLEADLLGQGVKLFPSTRAGDHAHLLWLKIKQPLFRGSALQITAGVLKLDWHRQKLKRG